VYEQDWILRQIALMGAAFRRMLQSISEQQPSEAIALAEETVRGLLQTDPSIVDRLTPEGLVTFFEAGGAYDVFRAHMLAEILFVRAEARTAAGQLEAAALDRERALAILRAALPDADGEQLDRILDLIGWLSEGVPAGTEVTPWAPSS
jgi:hypothetical protein